MSRKILFFLTLTTLLIASYFIAGPARAQDDIKYSKGWRARIYPTDRNSNIIDPPPLMEVGAFLANQPMYALGDYQSHVQGAPKLEYVLWRAEAFLNVEEPGTYVFSALTDMPSVSRAIYVEDVVVAFGQEYALMGARDLSPGLYKIEYRVAGALASYRKSQFKFLMKGPSDDRPRPISDVLLTPVKN